MSDSKSYTKKGDQELEAGDESLATSVIEAEASASSSNHYDHGVGGWFRRRGFKLEVENRPSPYAPDSTWSNADMAPTPPRNRTWRARDYLVYWCSDALAVSIWELGSSMVAIGLSWKLSIVAVTVGMSIMALIISIHGMVGARLRVPFPALARASFGFYFAYFPIISRLVLGIFWLGVTAVTGGQAVNQLINAIWPSYRHVRNHMPESSGITTAGMIAYLIYFFIQLPFLLIPYTTIRWFFLFKSIVAFIVLMAIMGTTVHQAGGVGASKAFGNATHGSRLAWTFLACVNSAIGNYATLGVNIVDFSRLQRSPKMGVQWLQIIIIPCIFTVVSSLGIITAAASLRLYGEVLWNPNDIIDHWRSSGGRAGAAFCSIGIIIATIGINVSANSISAANDLVAFCPKYINIRRGQIIAAILGCWALVPWEVLAQAQSFLSFMSGYTIFLAPITAIIMCDYFIIRRGRISVPNLYQPSGIYTYSNPYKTNWRSLISLLIGFVPSLPGLINYITPSIEVSEGGKHLFDLGYLYGFFVAGVSYWVFWRIWPDRGTMIEREDRGELWAEENEVQGEEAKDGEKNLEYHNHGREV